ncbi:MAG: SusC/RagA family TonB-linked outer membrane protein [Longimicrobiales bacterium]
MSTKALAVALLFTVVSGGGAVAQELVVTGRVTASDGAAPVAGATVLVERTGGRVVTDAQGRYRIEAMPDDTLRFEIIGYQTARVGVAARSAIDVVLEVAAFRLDELVVTALGRERERQALGYSVQEVAGAELDKTGEANVLSTLTGRVAGLVVYNRTGLFETPEYSLRGSKPLIVVDDVPMETAFWEISADDIENVSVLKGTSASALYGSRGRDGAILITTRKGDAGGPGHSITYNSSTLLQTGFTAIPEIQTQYGAGNGGQYAFRDGLGGGVFDGAGWIWGPKLDVADPSTPSGFKELPQYDSPIDPETGERIPTPWVSRGASNLDNFLRTGLTTTHSMAVSNTLANGYYRASLSHMFQNGQVPETHLNRSTFSLSGGYALSERLEADAFWSYGRVYTPNYPRLGYGPQNYVYNLLLWMGPDVDVRSLRSYWQEGKDDIQQKHYNYAWYNNPHFLAHENLQGYHEDINYGKLSLQYHFSPDLNLTIRSGLRQSSLTEDQADPLSLIRYDDPTNGNYIVETSNDLNINTDLLLEYRRRVSPDLEIRTTWGANSMWDERKGFFARTMGLSVPGLYNLTNSAAGIMSSSLLEKKRTASLFGGVDAAYRDMVFLGVTGRNDWSSALPPQNNSFFYPSISAAAVVSDLLPFSWLPYLKLRASWARVSSDPRIYSTTPVYERGVDWDGTPSVTFPDVVLNPNIQPETSTTLELGSEIRLPNNRLGLDITYYRTRDVNDIFEFPVSRASGFGFRLINANEYERRGWEVTLDASPLRRTNGLSWDLLLNWSQHRRYLIDLPGGVADLEGVRPGERMDGVRTTAFDRAPDGSIIYEGGLPTADPTARVLGYYDPSWIAGLTNQLSYGNFGLNFQIDGRYKGIIYSETIRKMWWGGTHPGTVTNWRDDENEGRATYVGEGVVVVSGDVVRDERGNIVEDTRVFAPNETPIFWSTWINGYYHGAVDEPNLHDGSFVKLRELSLTYRLPAALANRFGARNASIALVGRNLWLWSKIEYIDPDGVIEYDALQTPSSRNVGLNVNITF